MKYLHFGFFVLCLLFGSSVVQAQDTLVMKRTGAQVAVRVTEIDEAEIRYMLWPVDTNSKEKKIAKMRLRSVKLQSGQVFTFYPEAMFDPQTYNKQCRLLLKLEPLAWRGKSTLLWAEYAIKPRFSVEGGYTLLHSGVGLLGNNNEKVTGNEWGIGAKFYLLLPTRKSTGSPRLMKGLYWKPEFNALQYTTDLTYAWRIDTNDVLAASGSYIDKYSTKAWSVFNTLGYQHIFKFGLSIEAQLSFGIGKRNYKLVEDGRNSIPNIVPVNGGFVSLSGDMISGDVNQYGFNTSTVNALVFTTTTRLKIGYLLWPRWNKKASPKP